MCKAVMALVLLLLVVPRSAVAQNTPAIDRIDRTPLPGVFQRAVASNATRITLARSVPRRSSHSPLQQTRQGRSLIGRHPVLFGTLVGFGAGFLVGYLPGDDGVFDDFTAGFNGWVLGGVGGGIGAGVGAIVGAATK